MIDGNSIARVDHGISRGTFNLDGQTFDVDNNFWVVGDEAECIVIDAPHSVSDILTVVGRRRVKAIVCTHAHDDHVRAAPALRQLVNGGYGAPVMLHPADKPIWELSHPHSPWDLDLTHGQTLEAGGAALLVLHTPGHSPGAVCLYARSLGCVFTGDTLSKSAPGAIGRSYSDSNLIEQSIRVELFALPGRTVVHAGHGENTTLLAERARMTAERIRDQVALRLDGLE